MNNFRKIIICTAAAVGLLTACNKQSLQDLNIDPQAANTIDVNFLFTSAELGAASAGSSGDDRFTDWRSNIGMASTAIQQLATSGGDISSTGDKYLENSEVDRALWDLTYPDQLKNIGIILRETGPGGYAEGQNNNTRQAPRILRAFLFHRLTDLYGSIPYFETLRASEGVFFPKYDKQKDIYTDLLKELDEATAAFGETDAGFSAADIYYDGDIAKWKKWGYSLMLRLAMRVSNVAPDMANTYVAKAVAGGVFQSNADNTIVPMAIGPSLWTNQNGISRALIPADGGNASFLSKTLVDFLKGSNGGSTADDDPRLMILIGGIGAWKDVDPPVLDATANINPLDQKGMPNGKDQNMLETIEGNPDLDVNATYSRINPKFLNRDEPYMLMNYGEVELLLAEASERSIGGLVPAAAAAHYNAGVKASMQMYTIYDPTFTVSDLQVATYLAAHAYGIEKPALEMIGEQLWVNHFLNWWEAWAEWRRTGFPKLIPVNYPGNVTNGQIPKRLRYPNGEVSGNPNFKTGASANDYTTNVWWAGGPE